MSTIYVPTGFSWVAASLLSIATLLQWQTIAVGNARGRAKIPYPRAYADKAEQEASKDAMVFNCTQRAHQNTLENVPVIVTTTLISALHYPIPAAVGCGLWTLSRIVYTLTYGTGEPRKRTSSVNFGFLIQTLQTFLSAKVVFDLVKGGI